MKKMIDKKQLQLIHIAKNQLGLDDEIYRETLTTKYNVTSSKNLTYNQGSHFIGYLVNLGFDIKKKKSNFQIKAKSKIITLATKKQHKLIEILKKNITWKYEDGYNRFIKKRLKIEKVISCKDAQKVINALKGLLDIDTRIIELQALPFPFNPITFKFKNKKYAWFYDINTGRLIKINVYGEELLSYS